MILQFNSLTALVAVSACVLRYSLTCDGVRYGRSPCSHALCDGLSAGSTGRPGHGGVVDQHGTVTCAKHSAASSRAQGTTSSTANTDLHRDFT